MSNWIKKFKDKTAIKSDEIIQMSWANTRTKDMVGAILFGANPAWHVALDAEGEYFYSEDWISTPRYDDCVKVRLAIKPTDERIFISKRGENCWYFTDEEDWKEMHKYVPSTKFFIIEVDLLKHSVDYKIGDTPHG